MDSLLPELIESLREELKQYGGTLALLDPQQNRLMERHPGSPVQSTGDIPAQSALIAAARCEREQRQRHVARKLNLPENSSFAAIMPLLPADYRPLVQALVQENHELFERIHRLRTI